MTIDSMMSSLLARRSVKAAELLPPAPDKTQLEQMLTAAVRVPDHGKLAPWRLVIFEKEGQKKLGDLFAKRFLALNPDANAKQIAFEAARPQRSALMVAVLSVPKLGKIPLWEQELSAGAVCMNLLHAAGALGFAGQWLTEWPAFDREITQALCAEEGAKIAGFIYLGTAQSTPDDRPRPSLDDVVSYQANDKTR